MSSPYAKYKTDAKLEKEGVKFMLSGFWFWIARAGGANTKFQQEAERVFKPYRRAIQTNALDAKTMDTLLKEVYVNAVVLGWGSDEHGEGLVEDENGEPMECTPENCMKLFDDLPDVWAQVQQMAVEQAAFRQFVREDDAKN